MMVLNIHSYWQQGTKCQCLINSEGNFEVFHPTGDTLHQWGEIWHIGANRIHSKFYPHQCSELVIGYGPPKVKFYQLLNEIFEYTRGIQRVPRLTKLITRYIVIFCHFST